MLTMPVYIKCTVTGVNMLSTGPFTVGSCLLHLSVQSLVHNPSIQYKLTLFRHHFCIFLNKLVYFLEYISVEGIQKFYINLYASASHCCVLNASVNRTYFVHFQNTYNTLQNVILLGVSKCSVCITFLIFYNFC